MREALDTLRGQSGLEILVSADALKGKRARGVKDARSPQEALTALLAGSGLVYVMDAPSRATVHDIVHVQATGESTLDEILIGGRGDGAGGGANATGYGRADGFVASRSLTGTKTDTPLIETPQSIAVIPSEQIKAQGAQTLGSTLRYSAGLSGEVYGPDIRGFSLQVRGLNFDDSLFFRDGLRLSGTDFTSFLALDPYGAERIEVLRGPSSVLYGQSAPAGILNYVSKRPTDYAFGEISGSVGSWDRYQGEFDFGGPVGTDGVWSYRMTGLARDGDAQFDHFSDDRAFFAPAVTYKPDEDTTLTVLGNYQKDHQGYSVQFLPALGTLYRKNGRFIPSDRLTGEPGDYYDLETASLGYMFEHAFNAGLKVRQNARYSWLENKQQGSYGAGYVDRANSDLYNRVADFGHSSVNAFAIDNQAEIKFDTDVIRHTMLVGTDYRVGRYKDRGGDADIAPIDIFNPVYGAQPGPFTLYQDTTTSERQVGVYAQDQIKLGHWALTLGGRQDWSDIDTDDHLADTGRKQAASAFTGRAGLVYLFDNGLAPYVSYAESFFPVVGRNRQTQEAFKPETGTQYEAGVKYQPTGWNSFLTVSAFDLTRQNYSRTMGNFTVQTGEVRVKGFEVEGVASLRSGWNATLAYAHIDAEITKGDDYGGGLTTTGKTPYTVPTHRFSAWLDYTVQTGALKGFGAGGGVRVNSRTWGDDINTYHVPAVALFDAMVSYKRDDWRFQVNATNLADKRYVAGCQGPSAYCFYGEARKVIAKLTYSWGGPSKPGPLVAKN